MYKITDKNQNFPEISFSLRVEGAPWLWEPYRVYVQNDDQVALVLPAKGSFNNGYNYLAVWPLHGYGGARIRKDLEGRHRHFPFDVSKVAPILAELTLKLRKMHAEYRERYNTC